MQQNGVNGYKLTSKKSGNTNSIFLPAAGCSDGSSLYSIGKHGVYWTNSVMKGASYNACYLLFDSNGSYWYTRSRCYGLSVRPVYDD